MPSTELSHRNNIAKLTGMFNSTMAIAIVRAIKSAGAKFAMVSLLQRVHGTEMPLNIFLFDRLVRAVCKLASVTDDLWIVLAMDMAASAR
jgi:hypothetical protein